VSITTKVVSSNPTHGEMYSIQHYVIKVVTGRWLSPGTTVSSTNKTDHHGINDLLFDTIILIQTWIVRHHLSLNVIINRQISDLMRMMCFWKNNLHQIGSRSKDLKDFSSKKTKGLQQSPLSEEWENISFNINYII
jgi:hypothetical protein